MPRFTGVDHVVLTVTDLEVSTAFYSDVMGLLPLLDFGYGRLFMDRRTGFTIGDRRPRGGARGRFTELTTGLDHVGFGVDTLEELVEWERHLEAHGVELTPIRDMAARPPPQLPRPRQHRPGDHCLEPDVRSRAPRCSEHVR